MGALMEKLSCEYSDMKYSLGNTYEMTKIFIENPALFIHPTQTASKLAAQTLYRGKQRFVSPINFAQLAAAA
ncbi:hypothetical protein QYF36_011806 [Acer negundo]|nr:hypothetical protein QYF36_011806 [Acer negundo]